PSRHGQRTSVRVPPGLGITVPVPRQAEQGTSVGVASSAMAAARVPGRLPARIRAVAAVRADTPAGPPRPVASGGRPEPGTTTARPVTPGGPAPSYGWRHTRSRGRGG